ncbi:MAG: pyridoxamine 5'-phosphate oxidase family protein [Nanoarchaeota archaeon]
MEEKIKKLIEKNPVAISTSSKNGTPNISVAAFLKIKDEKIIITNNYMKKTIDNIKENPKISLAVWDDKWKGYKIDGLAEYSESEEWISFIKNIKENKNEPCNGAIIVKPLNIKQIG